MLPTHMNQVLLHLPEFLMRKLFLGPHLLSQNRGGYTRCTMYKIVTDCHAFSGFIATQATLFLEVH